MYLVLSEVLNYIMLLIIKLFGQQSRDYLPSRDSESDSDRDSDSLSARNSAASPMGFVIRNLGVWDSPQVYTLLLNSTEPNGF